MPDATLTGRSARDVVAMLSDVLTTAGIRDAKAEARDILAAVLDMPRLWPSLHADDMVDERVQSEALRAARHRAAGAPFAYAVGRAAFRHFTLDVDERVLIPRQETEQLVECVLELAGDWGGTAVDIGTGSGAIALSLATEARFGRVIATDVSEGALAVARENATRLAGALNTPVEFRQGSLLAPLSGERVRVIVSNPPYISHDEAKELPAGVRDWEPPVALFSGAGGMDATVAIIRGAAAHLEPGGLLALEVDTRRAVIGAELALASGHYADVSVRLDLAGRERILLARRTNR
ncbi:MAG TPA: peptide chain release factor N(5)-glutamine methyltransferase [Gemmatimonadaceae bacterium]|nr:peptide chain release factor N(5)-glutamine methyltransferase [Gemmatimonadaceae bacterium]